MAHSTNEPRSKIEPKAGRGGASPAWLVGALLFGLAAPFCYGLTADSAGAWLAGFWGDARLWDADWLSPPVVLGFALGSLIGLLCGRARRAPPAAPAGDSPVLTQLPQNRALEKRTRVRDLFAGDIAALFSDRVEVRSLMSEAPETVPPTMSAEEVAAAMRRHRVRHVLVSAVYGKVLGIISDRDVRSRNGRTAAELMTADPVCISPSAMLGEAVDLMLEKNVSCLPVLRGVFLCGIITTADVLLGMRCALDELQRAARDLQCDTSAAVETAAD